MQAVLSTLLLLLVGKFQSLFSLAIFAEWLIYGLTVSTVFVFRKRDDPATRPYSMIGYPVLPVIFMIAAATLTVFSVVNDPKNSLAGVAVILAGVPLHYMFKRRKAPGTI